MIDRETFDGGAPAEAPASGSIGEEIEHDSVAAVGVRHVDDAVIDAVAIPVSDLDRDTSAIEK